MGLNRIGEITYLFSSGISSENGSKNVLLIRDISFISDGWSYTWNPGRFPARSS
jgi:hypothetical protein